MRRESQIEPGSGERLRALWSLYAARLILSVAGLHPTIAVSNEAQLSHEEWLLLAETVADMLDAAIDELHNVSEPRTVPAFTH